MPIVIPFLTQSDICTPRLRSTFSSPPNSAITHLIDRQRDIKREAIIDEEDRPYAFLSERGFYKRRRSAANLTSTFNVLLTALDVVRTLHALYTYTRQSVAVKGRCLRIAFGAYAAHERVA